jgi:hypothetical protein
MPMRILQKQKHNHNKKRNNNMIHFDEKKIKTLEEIAKTQARFTKQDRGYYECQAKMFTIINQPRTKEEATSQQYLRRFIELEKQYQTRKQ